MFWLSHIQVSFTLLVTQYSSRFTTFQRFNRNRYITCFLLLFACFNIPRTVCCNDCGRNIKSFCNEYLLPSRQGPFFKYERYASTKKLGFIGHHKPVISSMLFSFRVFEQSFSVFSGLTREDSSHEISIAVDCDNIVWILSLIVVVLDYSMQCSGFLISKSYKVYYNILNAFYNGF